MRLQARTKRQRSGDILKNGLAKLESCLEDARGLDARPDDVLLAGHVVACLDFVQPLKEATKGTAHAC